MKRQQYLSFLIPFFIFVLIGISIGIFLVKDQTMLISDLGHQYISLFAYLKDVFNGSQSLFYSFSKGLGGNMLGTFAYYLSSPLNLLILFFSKQNLPYAIFLIVSIKIGLSGLTMHYYLSKQNSIKDNALLMFSTSYALMGFNVVYFFNVMWLDVVFLTPLLLVGIDKILKKESSLFYGFVLMLSIFSNYYMGFILCVFACLYLVYKLLINFKLSKDIDDLIEIVTKFSITSLLSGLMCSFILLPTLYDLVANVSRSIPSTLGKFNGTIGMFFSRLTIGSHNVNNILNQQTPAIYLGLIMLPLVYFYFVNKNINKKTKIFSFILLIILSIGIYSPRINILWHGNSSPNSFNFRFSYLISLFMIALAYKSFKLIEEIDLKHYLIFLIIYLLMSTVVIVQNFEHITNIFIIFGALLTMLYLLLLYIYGKSEKREKKLIKLLMMLLVFSELFFNFQLSINKYEYKYKNEYIANATVYNEKINNISPIENEFYRIERQSFYTLIDSMFYNYYGGTIFLSTLNKKTSNFYNNVDFPINANKVNYNVEAAPITNSILGMKYIVGGRNSNYNIYDEFEFSKFNGVLFDLKKTKINIYENPNALALSFMVSDDINNFVKYFKQGKITNNFEFQNYIIKTMINKDIDVLKRYETKKINDKEYLIFINNQSSMYLSVHSPSKGSKEYEVGVYLNKELKKTLTYYDGGLFKVDNNYENDFINLTFKTKHDIQAALLYYADEQVLDEAVTELKKNQLTITKFDKNHIKGNITATKEKPVMFTSVPYEKGWTVLVDGKKTEYYDVYDMFIALDLSEGYHEIEFKFTPPYFKLGVVISIISTILFILYISFEKCIIGFILKTYNKYEEIIKYLIAGALTTVVSVSSYAIFSKLMNINYLISSILSFTLAVLFAYFTNKYYVFESVTENNKELSVEIIQFLKYRVVSLAVEIFLMILLVSVLNIDDLLSKVMVQVVIVIINYFFSKVFIFK